MVNESQNPIAPTDDAGSNAPSAVNENLDIIEIEREPKKKAGNITAFGTSGTRIFGEIFDEEYLSRLTGYQRADIYDEMTRSDDVITMLLTARKNPIIKAQWDFEEPEIPTEGLSDQEVAVLEEKYKKITQHCRHEFFERMEKDFKDYLEDWLTFIDQGYCLIERVHEIVKDPLFGSYVGYRDFGWRSQRTIERWTLLRNGKIERVFQQADGDLGNFNYIPGQYVTVFTHRKRGDNYEGISSLRPIYGNWQRKMTFLKLLAIGIERYAIQTPVGKVPVGKESSREKQIFEKMLKMISSHQNNYMTLAQGWEVDFLQNAFDADKVVKAIAREDEGMVKSFVANHLNLGQGGGSGSYALGTDLSDQFLSIIENDADVIVRRFNKEIIREFVDLNYGKQSVYPKLKVSGINDKLGKEFADILKLLGDGKFITPTENIEVSLRKRLGIPDLLEQDKAVIDDVRETEKASLFSEEGNSIQLADTQKQQAKVRKQLGTSAEVVTEGMQKELDKRAQELITNTINRMRKTTPSKWREVIRTSQGMAASAEYRRQLKKALTETAGRAVSQARNEVPGGRNIKFAEGISSRMSYQLAEDNFKNLPKKTQEVILTDVKFVPDQQFTSIGNAILLTANNAVDTTEDLAVIEKRMNEERQRRIEGQGETGVNGAIVAAASNTTAKVYNTARLEFFQDDDVLEKIEAFQFMNSDPKSPICKDLKGRIFPKNDPESARFLPPLHHNCKSYIVPIFKLQGREISSVGLKPSNPELEKFITL